MAKLEPFVDLAMLSSLHGWHLAKNSSDSAAASGIDWLINWPLAVLLVAILILFTLSLDSKLRQALGKIGRGVRSVSVSGVEFALNSETAPELSADFKQTISVLGQVAQKYYGHEANVHDLQPLLKQFMTDALPHKIKKSKRRGA